jgi:hypothetical protein
MIIDYITIRLGEWSMALPRRMAVDWAREIAYSVDMLACFFPICYKYVYIRFWLLEVLVINKNDYFSK